ncbi:hypothetical protein AVEN_228342-1 [Araneus ventricosus]|uniref:Uncharacterized protein n=1 Tax=Araneus ventricosus TaxID=182803 RepID=A0A4Y2K629_ARAVE|nr:hypothetical protein AVEN_228342-1 [Araneus ventricosus]
MRLWKLQAWRFSVSVGTYCGNDGSLQQVNNIRWVSQALSGYGPASYVGLTGPPAIHTKSRCNGQHRLCQRYSIVEVVFLFSKVSQQLVVTFSSLMPLSLLFIFFQKNLFQNQSSSPSTTHQPAILNPPESRSKLTPSRQYFKKVKVTGRIKFYPPREANLAKYFTSGYFAQLIVDSLSNWSEALLSATNLEFSFNWENGEILRSYYFYLSMQSGYGACHAMLSMHTGQVFPLDKVRPQS